MESSTGMKHMIGIDTNILFYFFDNTPEKHEKAKEIILEIFKNPTNYRISTQVVLELNNSTRKKLGKNNEKVVELSQEVLSSDDLLVSYSQKELALALSHKNIFDALIAYTYTFNGCSIIYTENGKDMPKIDGVEYVNPFL